MLNFFHIRLVFPNNIGGANTNFDVEQHIINAVWNSINMKVTKFRLSYLEIGGCLYTIPDKLMLAILLVDKGGYGWMLPRFSGTYKLVKQE